MAAWNADENADLRGPLDVSRAATMVIDARDTVVGWSPAAERLLGYRPEEVVGRPLSAFLSPGPSTSVAPLSHRLRGNETRTARRRDGLELVLATAVSPLSGSGTAERVLIATELKDFRLWDFRLALFDGLATQSPVGLAVYDTDLRLIWCNTAYEREIGRPFAEFRGLRADALYAGGRFVTKGHPPTLEAVMRRVLDTGEPFLDLHFRGRPPSDPETDHLWSCAYYRLQDADGHVFGVCEDAFDISDRHRAQQRLALLVEAGRGIGTALDVMVTARKVTEVAVPGFATTVTVDLAGEVLEGEVPAGSGVTQAPLVRAAHCSAGDEAAAGPGGTSSPSPVPERSPVEYPSGSPQDRCLSSGGLVLDDTTLVVPLRAGDGMLGLVTFVRGAAAAVFDGGEVALADELVARTAVSIDNARRFTRERTAALTLQRQLLPQKLPEGSAGELAYRYLPTDDVTGVGGDWFDVIPLSGARVGLVVGDVVGHGLQAAATMGRLRTTVHAFAQMDMDPVELLSRLDDLVAQSAEEQWGEMGMADGTHADVTTGATCLYAVYDPVSRRCVMARAGHLPPAVVAPDGRVSFPDLPAGPPLGLGGLPFESMEVELPVGSLLALFTDGLVEARDRDIDHGLAVLGRVLSDRCASLDQLCDRVVAELLPGGSTADDTALLLVRTRELDHTQVASWELPAEPVTAGRFRDLTTRQLHRWGLEELSFTTELVVSELVTNAVRYAEGPVQVRLIRDRTLWCEVADTGHTSPHLRHSGEDDEGGRGLFIVAQLVQRWGTRYSGSGKTIWTEQALPGPD
ncbi:SpoIIE family protein phosphatase [Streptomyces sp. M92]|uniref:SpoIIE family protein phosphatase n=1 Tax=Streptomyces sp. M92 TaxID=2944250 RepID=UPI00234BCD53|nr:SpoIIE family protein phosphatase [Streptomyces sp. M92]WCN05461.1 SpoIIE family protein phosphatase [Streptomyces sp. M92]